MPTPPVDDNEVMFRQIGPGGDPIYFDPTKRPAIHRSVFLPHKKDIDGLSLIRNRFRRVIWSAYRLEQPNVRFRLAPLGVAELSRVAAKVGIQARSYRPTPDVLDERFGEPWAHCVINEINRTKYELAQVSKRQIKEGAFRVADLITSQDVLGPYQEPTGDDKYRPALSYPQ